MTNYESLKMFISCLKVNNMPMKHWSNNVVWDIVKMHAWCGFSTHKISYYKLSFPCYCCRWGDNYKQWILDFNSWLCVGKLVVGSYYVELGGHWWCHYRKYLWGNAKCSIDLRRVNKMRLKRSFYLLDQMVIQCLMGVGLMFLCRSRRQWPLFLW
jgi:hypothetical protein